MIVLYIFFLIFITLGPVFLAEHSQVVKPIINDGFHSIRDFGGRRFVIIC